MIILLLLNATPLSRLCSKREATANSWQLVSTLAGNGVKLARLYPKFKIYTAEAT